LKKLFVFDLDGPLAGSKSSLSPEVAGLLHDLLGVRDQLGIPLKEMRFAGDAVFVGGNDYPVQTAGVDSILVRDPKEPTRVIQAVIACVGHDSVQIVSPGKAS